MQIILGRLDTHLGRPRQAQQRLRAAYDGGQPPAEYWAAVGARLGIAVDDPLAERLTAADIAGWLHPDPAALDLLDELRSAPVQLALLSNAPAVFGRAAERQDWTRGFQHLLFSGDVQLIKPDPRIYRLLLDRIGARAAECLFFDDRPDNVRAAQECGMRAELWRGAPAARSGLRERGAITP
ncbi:HAD family phosphatase [Saccharopolyspora sp. HNM0983]|uniref:HAD family phosphatase n=1 Tax=Saccharopolyspora montiporae TaxID=2781240 RepID=A0A929B9N3_9PSEU|nr:HAD family phosphatase [Saccharopolyspora sp. HNM0983]MBE9374745.1 HAD family phosphatase [Saccharopolyspora sp. HNM0983]